MDPVTEDLYFLVASRPEIFRVKTRGVKKVEISVGQKPPWFGGSCQDVDVSG